jgi:hypothetical protein
MLLGHPRDQATLEYLISRWVAPNSTITTDGWAGYNNLAQIPGMNYTHLTVNHQQNFVDPVTGANTQTVEGANKLLREALPERGVKGGWENYSLKIGGRYMYKRLVRHHPAFANADPVRLFLHHLDLWYDTNPDPFSYLLDVFL